MIVVMLAAVEVFVAVVVAAAVECSKTAPLFACRNENWLRERLLQQDRLSRLEFSRP